MAKHVKLPVVDPAAVPARKGASYPQPFGQPVSERSKRALGDAARLGQFGVNLVELPPGCWSSQRHWHTREDEFVYVLEGELTLVTDEGEQILVAGLAAGFPAGTANGHHLVNRSDRPARYLEVGTRARDDECHYPDIDLFCPRDAGFTNKKGEPY